MFWLMKDELLGGSYGLIPLRPKTLLASGEEALPFPVGEERPILRTGYSLVSFFATRAQSSQVR